MTLKILKDETEDRELTERLEGLKDAAGTIVVVEEYPTDVSEKPTMVVLKNLTQRKLLICDTERWWEINLQPMEATE